ncbi:unnamed protein product [Arctogadus glacialis]
MENSSTELLPGGESPMNKRMTETLLASLTQHERQVILSIPAAQNQEDLRLFARLLHYFRGHHHLEEIMYNENMRRSQLKTLFDKFRSVLVVTNHEDPIVSSRLCFWNISINERRLRTKMAGAASAERKKDSK